MGNKPETDWGIKLKIDSYSTTQITDNYKIEDGAPSLYNGQIAWHGGSNSYPQIYLASDLPTLVPEPISSILFLTGGATLGFKRLRKTITN